MKKNWVNLLQLGILLIGVAGSAVAYVHINFADKKYVDDKHEEVMRYIERMDRRIYEIYRSNGLKDDKD